MLALIYSEIAQRLLRWGYIDFQVQMQLPSDPITLPQPQAVREDGGTRSSLDLCRYELGSRCNPFLMSKVDEFRSKSGATTLERRSGF